MELSRSSKAPDELDMLEPASMQGPGSQNPVRSTDDTPEAKADKEMTGMSSEMADGQQRAVSSERPSLYSGYVLLLLMLAYLLNQLDRYMLSIVTKPMAQDLHYGNQECFSNMSAPHHNETTCNATTSETCSSALSPVTGNHACEWNYNGQGFQYELIAGPIFIVIYTLVGIPLGFLADLHNRKIPLALAITFWSLMTLLMGFVTQYWQLAILRFGLGFGEAGCTPFAASLIADYFSADYRAAALGFYNWGIYMGYSLSYAVGNFVNGANILGQGWRWTYFISAIPGLVLGPLVFFTLREPQRGSRNGQTSEGERQRYQELLGHSEEDTRWYHKALLILKMFVQPSILILLLGGSIRNGAGYVWAYMTQIYYTSIGQTPEQIASYMSWVPLVGGAISVVLGGIISDRIVKKVGNYTRVIVLVVSQAVAAPFVAGAIFLDPPFAYISLIPGYIVGEMWVSITMTIIMELVPAPLRTASVAVYLFVISNIAGSMPLLVTPIREAFKRAGYSEVNSLKAALYILYPGSYVVAAILFVVTLFVLRWDLARVRRRLGYEAIDGNNK